MDDAPLCFPSGPLIFLPSSLSDSLQTVCLLQALGDLVESIAGAILIDSRLNVDEVWRVFKPILSPIVTPDKFELPPLRQLVELCDTLGFFMKENCLTKGETVFAELSVQLKDTLLIGEGYGPNRKSAKGNAALQLLQKLEVCLTRLTCKSIYSGYV